MDLTVWLRTLLDEGTDPTRLRAREVVGHDSARGQDDGILLDGFLFVSLTLDVLEVRPARAVSERKKSMTAKNSSPSSASRMKFRSGAKTRGFEQMSKSSRIRFSWIASSRST